MEGGLSGVTPGSQQGWELACKPRVLQAEVVEEGEADIGGGEGDALDSHTQ